MSRFAGKSAVFRRFLPIFSLGLAVFALERPVRAAEEGSGVIRGIAVDEQGQRLAQARIALTGETYWRSTESTNYVPPADPGLDFEFSGLPAGAYELHGMGEGIAPLAVELNANRMVLENLRVPTSRQADLNDRLQGAVRENRVDKVREWIAAGADPNQETWPGSLLTMAAANSGLDMVQALVEGGANVCVAPDAVGRMRYQHGISDTPFKDALTPYEHALWRRLPDMAAYLLAHGASTNNLLAPPPGAVRGRIVDENDQPVPDLSVELTWSNDTRGRVYRQTKTDADGVYFFPSVEPCPLAVAILGMASNPVFVAQLTPEAPEAEMPLLRIGKCVVPTQKMLEPYRRLDAETVAELVAQGADVNAVDRYGQTLLMKQAQFGNADLVRVLAENGADLRATDADGFTAVDLAVKCGQTNAIALLLELGAQPSSLAPPPRGTIGGVLLDEQDRPLPRIFLRCSAGEEAKMLDPLAFTEPDGSFRFDRLEPGEYDVRIISATGILLSATLAEPDSAVTNAVLRCARAEAVDIALGLHLQVDSPYVAEVLKAGADANRTNAHGQTALMIATENGYADSVQALLDAGAEVNAADPEGATALHLACRRGDTNIAARLIAAGAKLAATNRAGRTPLDVAVWEGRAELAQLLRAHGAPGSVAEAKAMGALSGTVLDETGAPVAHASVLCALVGDEIESRYGDMTDRAGRYRIGRLPLGMYEVQIDFDAENRKTVVLSNRDETVANVDFRKPSIGDSKQDGKPSLHEAAAEDHPWNLQRQLDAGTPVDATNRWGRTPLMVAAEKGQFGNVGLLLKAGADVDRIDDDGCSALHLACKNGNRNAVKQLIEAGADLAQTNRWGRTPLDEAVWENRPEAAKMLRAAGAPGTLTAPKPGGTIRGIVVDENGAPLRDVVLHVQRQASGMNEAGGHAEVRTEADGSFRMWGETAGCYRFASVSRLDDPVVVCLTNDWDVQTDVRVQVSRRCVQEAALFAAVAADDPEAAESLLAEGADPCAVDADNESLLEMALNQWATNVVPVLLAHGADLNAPGADGYTPLRRAASNWLSWKIPYLLRMGAAVRPEEGGSPLLLLDVVRREPGEDDRMRSFRRQRIAWCAKSARLLIEAGAALDGRDADGLTPLHHAALNGYAECAKVLMNAHVDEGATNAAGQTALDLAVAAGQAEVAAVLRRGAPAEPPPAGP
jgi:ankyrin repeat protein